MAEKKPPIAKRPVISRDSVYTPVAPSKPCSKPRNNSDDDSDDEDEYGYIQPEAQSGDLANLIREAGRLPICVKVLSDPQIKDADCKGGDILMIHCTDKEQVVKALGPTGKTFYLPVHSNQLYQMLPLDPRLDGKEYRGTMELVKANPLPQVVRVSIGYCDEMDEDDTKEQDDIITIAGVVKGRNDELYLVGKIMGEAQRFRAMEDEAVYTTQIISEHLSMSKVIKHNLPVRVRTVSTGSPSRRRPSELELRLECLIKRERVIATRARDGAVLAFPFSTPLKLDGITPPWNILPSLMTPLYPLVNTSMCMKGLSAVTLPYKAMKAVPQPKKVVLDEWLKSQEAKILINEIAEQENVEMQKKVASLMADLKRAESELNFSKSQRSPPSIPMAPSLPVRPPRSPGHLPSTPPCHLPGSPLDFPTSSPTGLEPPVPSRPSISVRTNIQEEEMGHYDVVEQNSSKRTSIGLASTDLEKELKNLLAEKVLEIQTKDKENRSLQEQNKILQSKLDKQTIKLSEMDQQLEALRDEEDCYDLMTPGIKNTSKRSPGKEHPILPNRPPKETSLKKTVTLRPPNIPLPSVPASQGTSTLTRGTEHKKTRAEYDPLPLSRLADKEDPSLRPRMKSPTKIISSARVPLPTEPLQPHPSLKSSDLMSLPLSQQTDSFKRSMTARPSHLHSISPVGEFASPSATVSEYDLPELAPPLPPLPVPRNVPVTQSSKISEYALPYDEVPTPPAQFRAKQSPANPLSPNHSFNPVMYATPDTNLNTFTKENVAVLLKSLNLDNCVSRFLEESVDGVLLMSIDEEMMMKELGMTRFQARKLTIKIDELTTR